MSQEFRKAKGKHRHPWVMVELALLPLLQSPRAIKTYMAIKSLQGNQKSVFAKRETIARRAGISVSGVDRALADLKQQGLITSVQRGKRVCNAYNVMSLRDLPEDVCRELLAAVRKDDSPDLTTVSCQDGQGCSARPDSSSTNSEAGIGLLEEETPSTVSSGQAAKPAPQRRGDEVVSEFQGLDDSLSRDSEGHVLGRILKDFPLDCVHEVLARILEAYPHREDGRRYSQHYVRFGKGSSGPLAEIIFLLKSCQRHCAETGDSPGDWRRAARTGAAARRGFPFLGAARRYFPDGHQAVANPNVWRIDECPFCCRAPAYLDLSGGVYHCFTEDRCEADETEHEEWSHLLGEGPPDVSGEPGSAQLGPRESPSRAQGTVPGWRHLDA